VTPEELPAWLDDPRRRPVVVGILNATPDSFSDGGLYLDPDAAAHRVRTMIDEGADWIDVGGESTRPGSSPVDPDEQIRRVIPAVDAGVRGGVVVSIDTSWARVAKAALEAGAGIVNDVTAGRADDRMPGVMATATAVVLMHMRGTPQTMQQSPKYDDVVADVETFLLDRAAAVGLAERHVLLDPGIGFGKTLDHNLALLRALPRLASHGRPLFVGTSRKRFIGDLTCIGAAADRGFGTAATVAWSVAHGASAVRVHDVAEMRQVVDVVAALRDP
jgi:dihydropteroate synthase